MNAATTTNNSNNDIIATPRAKPRGKLAFATPEAKFTPSTNQRAAWGSLDTPEAKRARKNQLQKISRQQIAAQKKTHKAMCNELVLRTQPLLRSRTSSLEADEHVRLKLVDREIELLKLRNEHLRLKLEMGKQAEMQRKFERQHELAMEREKSSQLKSAALGRDADASKAHADASKEHGIAAQKRAEEVGKLVEADSQRRKEEDAGVDELMAELDEVVAKEGATKKTTPAVLQDVVAPTPTTNNTSTCTMASNLMSPSGKVRSTAATWQPNYDEMKENRADQLKKSRKEKKEDQLRARRGMDTTTNTTSTGNPSSSTTTNSNDNNNNQMGTTTSNPYRVGEIVYELWSGYGQPVRIINIEEDSIGEFTTCVVDGVNNPVGINKVKVHWSELSAYPPFQYQQPHQYSYY